MTHRSAGTVLHVNDNEASLYANTRILTHAGYRVIESKTGAEALRLAASEVPELVLLDARLSDIPATEVCRRLKADPATDRMMILQISSGDIDNDAKVQGLDGGADGYLTEPVRGG